MRIGDLVRIHPSCDPLAVADARVVVASSNGESLAVEFEEPPPFTGTLLRAGRLGINRETWRVTLLLLHTSAGWTEAAAGEGYEIDGMAAAETG
jgi:hypothetical protein